MLKLGKLSNAYKKTFTGPDAEVVLGDLLKFCKYRDSTFVPGQSDSTIFNEGTRRVILRILSFIEMDESKITKLTKMLDEQQENLYVR